MAPTKSFKAEQAKKRTPQKMDASTLSPISKLRTPTYPPGILYELVWMACLVDDKFVFDAERMLNVIEKKLGSNNRHHHVFLDLKQYLSFIWPVPEFRVYDSDYRDAVGAFYISKEEKKAYREREGTYESYTFAMIMY